MSILTSIDGQYERRVAILMKNQAARIPWHARVLIVQRRIGQLRASDTPKTSLQYNNQAAPRDKPKSIYEKRRIKVWGNSAIRHKSPTSPKSGQSLKNVIGHSETAFGPSCDSTGARLNTNSLQLFAASKPQPLPRKTDDYYSSKLDDALWTNSTPKVGS